MIYQRLRDLREDHDLNQETIAKFLHVTQATYSRYESGITEISVSTLKKLAEYYHTSTDYLLGLTDNPAPYPPTKRRGGGG